MKCKNPIKVKAPVEGASYLGKFNNEYPCGQCMPCRITRRQEWTFRLLLELKEHPYAYFITLTYDDNHLPQPFSLLSKTGKSRNKLSGSLDKKAISAFIKRYRRYTGEKIRFFGVGEYGDSSDEGTSRPHYHLIIFQDVEAFTKSNRYGKLDYPDFEKAWTLNNTLLGHVVAYPVLSSGDGLRIARYVASYTVKKLTTDDSMQKHLYPGRVPEHTRMSRKPGIGLQTYTINNLVDKFKNYGLTPHYIEGSGVTHSTGDIHMFRIDGKKYPVARTLKEKIIDRLGGDFRSDVGRALNRHMASNARALTTTLEEEYVKAQDSDKKAKKLYKQIKKNQKI